MKLVASQQCSNKVVVELMLPDCKVWWGVSLELIYVHSLKPFHYIYSEKVLNYEHKLTPGSHPTIPCNQVT